MPKKLPLTLTKKISDKIFVVIQKLSGNVI